MSKAYWRRHSGVSALAAVVLIIVAVVALVGGYYAGIGAAQPAAITTADTTKIIREAADSYLSAGKPPVITPDKLYKYLTDDDPTNDPYILDIRKPDDYAKGHIPTAVNVPFRQVFKEENIANLPKDRLIVTVCYTGHTASQTAALLNAMGYDALALKFGICSWTTNKDLTAHCFVQDKHAMNYPTVEGTEPGSFG